MSRISQLHRENSVCTGCNTIKLTPEPTISRLVCGSCSSSLVCTTCSQLKELKHFAKVHRRVPKCNSCVMKERTMSPSQTLECSECGVVRGLHEFSKRNRAQRLCGRCVNRQRDERKCGDWRDDIDHNTGEYLGGGEFDTPSGMYEQAYDQDFCNGGYGGYDSCNEDYEY